MVPALSERSARLVSGNVARLDFDNLERFGQYTRLHFENRSFTNAEELAHAGRIARVLKERGVKPGDRVIAIMPNSPDLSALFQAVWMIGGIMAPVMPNWTPTEIVPVLRNAEPAAIVTIPPIAARVQPALAGLPSRPEMFVFGKGCGPEIEDLADLSASADPIESPADRGNTDLALLLFTSGTTASPKGAMLSHGNLHAALDSIFRMHPDQPRGSMLHMLPLAHSFGLLMLNLANGWGFSSVLVRQFDPLRAFETIDQYGITHMPVVPTMLVYLANHPERMRFNLSSLRRVTSGGAALPEQLRREFGRVFQCRVDQGYGLSESVAVATSYNETEPYRPGSAGRPAPGVHVRIAGANNETLAPHDPGEICLAGDHLMQGYWRDPDATTEAITSRWFRTGDIGYVDEEGYLYITDRKKDLIIKGGENISPREIEEAIHLHPAVAAAAVVGVPDAVFGESICAVVQLKPGAQATEDEIREHASTYVTKFKAPSHVQFWPELPRNYTGKISKRDIRDRLSASR